MRTGAIHHVELWVEDLPEATASWGWLLGRLGYSAYDTWADGASWRLGDAYVVVEAGPDRRPGVHDRQLPGLNHLAFWGGTRAEVDALCREAPNHGWRLLFTDRYPYAGGPDHYACYLENDGGFEVEIVAEPVEGGPG
ncbi:VOC family protein [Beutenbergia cavernae]|uniref:VOC family protein n=1 Tax=Beutenbergia cavernae TaxID=84757 RepID=UPI00019ACD85|nr:VOC family protein [Beutenbergia cavernae]